MLLTERQYGLYDIESFWWLQIPEPVKPFPPHWHICQTISIPESARGSRDIRYQVKCYIHANIDNPVIDVLLYSRHICFTSLNNFWKTRDPLGQRLDKSCLGVYLNKTSTISGKSVNIATNLQENPLQVLDHNFERYGSSGEHWAQAQSGSGQSSI